MELFREKLRDMVPVMKRQYRKDANNVMYQEVGIEGSPEDFYDTPYLKPVKEFCEQVGDVVGKRVFLVTENETIGLKAAFGIVNYPIYENWDEICGQIEEAGYCAEHAVTEGKLPLSIRLVSDKDYIALLKGEMFAQDIYYFTGLDEEVNNSSSFESRLLSMENENKLKCIMSCQASLQFVQINRAQINTAWARELMMDRECEVLFLPEVESSYYEQVLEELLEGERYRLDDALMQERLIKNIRKKCGNRFGEEDIAWSLDQAMKSARFRGEYHVLMSADFAFDSFEEQSPLSRLCAMTGLKGMKRLAYEYAALGREQVRNHKLMEVCKHVIFSGRPGTGKTMCGQILAQVMAEQGQSNGVFISASRKDIIGEHVGQTAPMVAGLFAKARNGVLFVDEAGFLMHETRASYNQEAIKEFVRYMELYQDVTVIFALYPNEVEDWLKLDMGLSSRISRVIEFEDYSRKELLEITRGMCESKGYCMAGEAMDTIGEYIDGRRRLLGEEFGNAREMRKLVESAIIAKSIRCYEQDMTEAETVLTIADFEYGAERLRYEKARPKAQIGFVAGGI